MIEFLTLFLGLVSGPLEVAVAVREPVARVELYVDGELAAGATEEPWRFEVDLGDSLLPHELAAAALAADGEVVGRAVQRLNVPRSPAEVSLSLDRATGGKVTGARLVWESRVAASPLAIRAWLDGVELDAVTEERIELPAYDLERFHLLEAELEFSGSVFARGEVGFGGHLGTAGTELTAVPVRLADPERSPEPAAMAGWLRRGDNRLEVMAVETGSAEVVLVRDRWAAAALRDLPGGPGIAASGRLPGLRAARLRKAFEATLLGEDQRLRILYPIPRRATGHQMSHEIFPLTPRVAAADGGIYWHAAEEVAIEEGGETRLADAVAVAANQAATGGHRRAVVLMIGPRSVDSGSRYDAATVRRYLEALGVPLEVWYLGRARKAPAEWGEPRAISSFKQLEDAVEHLVRRLDRQRVVWVKGSFLLSAIELRGGGTQVELVR